MLGVISAGGKKPAVPRKSRNLARFLTGTSGWNYGEWQGRFYPEDLPARKWLSYYAERFGTVEVNYSFYHLPRETTYANWYAQTSPEFVFALKASRFITHIKRLRDVEQAWKEFVRRALELKEKLGPILLQFPPSFHASPENLELMEDFLSYAVTRRSPRIAMEFRHQSCFEEKVLALLRRYRTALVVAHSRRYPIAPVIATSDLAYFRFHGPRELFASSYSDAELREWAVHMGSLLGKGCDVYAYFNNDAGGYAVSNAKTLARIMESAGMSGGGGS